MSENKNSQKNKKRASLYSIICICLAVAGASSYLCAKRNIDALTPQEPFSVTITQRQTTEIASETQVNEKLEGIADERETTTEGQEAKADETQLVEVESPIVRAESFTLPIDTQIIKGYSDSKVVYSKTTDDWRSHNGIDFAGNMGDPVIAVNNGIVIYVYDDTLWGTVVEIDHGDGLVAKYCGLGKGSTVKVGDEVKINQKIGNLSEIPIEKNDGVHLHFETTFDGMVVNPIIALGMNESEIR